MAGVIYRLPPGIGPRPIQRDATSVAGRGADAATRQQRMNEEARNTPSEDEQILADRKQRKKIAESARERTGQWTTNPKDLYERSLDMGDVFRLFPNDPNSVIDDYLNPMVAIGGMAGGLERIPYNVQQGNYGEAALDLATPIFAGALEKAAEIARPMVGKYLTTQTPLANAYKLNPYAYAGSPGMMYRGVGREGMADAIGTGYFRAKPNVAVEYFPGTKLPMQKDFTGATYWTPNVNVARKYADVIAEVPEFTAEFVNRYGPNKSWSQLTNDKIFVDDARFYVPHWLHGLKRIDNLKNPSTKDYLRSSASFIPKLPFSIRDVTPTNIARAIESTDLYRNKIHPKISDTEFYKVGKNLVENPWMYNPFAYKVPEGMMVRGVGPKGVEDLMQTGILRAKGYPELYATEHLPAANLFAESQIPVKNPLTGKTSYETVRGEIVEFPRSAAPEGWTSKYGYDPAVEYWGKGLDYPVTWSERTPVHAGFPGVPIEKVRILEPRTFRGYVETKASKQLRKKRKK